MKRIDARSWSKEIQDALANAAVTGGALVDIDDNRRVLVLDERLWESVENKLPSLSDVIRDIKSLPQKG